MTAVVGGVLAVSLLRNEREAAPAWTGMTDAQVQVVVGHPADLVIGAEDGSVSRIWFGRDTTLVLGFDRGGRVADEFEYTPWPQPTLLGRIQAWLQR
jgi:hypothetical protein